MDRINKAAQQVTRKKSKNAGPSSERDRSSNWEEMESDILINAAQDVQLKNGRKSLNFTTTDANEIHAMVCQKIPAYVRKPCQLITRIRTMKKEFTILNRLANRSGWSWNYRDSMLVPPSPEILKQVLEDLGKRWRYLGKKKFPWFAQMEELMGGTLNRGSERDMEFPTTEVSATGSQTGSSDNPPDDEDENAHENAEMDQSIRQPNCNNQPMVGQGSEDSFPVSRSSGSNKRKSTDSGEPSTHGKKVQLALKERRREIKEMNATSKEMLETAKEIVKGKSKKTDEMDSCIEKMDQLNLRGHLRYWCLKQAEKQWFRRYFLHATIEQILEDFYCAMNPPQPNQPTYGATPNPPQPNPPTYGATQPNPPTYGATPNPPQPNPPTYGATPNPPTQPSFNYTLSDNFNIFGLNPHPPNH